MVTGGGAQLATVSRGRQQPFLHPIRRTDQWVLPAGGDQRLARDGLWAAPRRSGDRAPGPNDSHRRGRRGSTRYALADGRCAACWGSNSYGQLGDPAKRSALTDPGVP